MPQICGLFGIVDLALEALFLHEDSTTYQSTTYHVVVSLTYHHYFGLILRCSRKLLSPQSTVMVTTIRCVRHKCATRCRFARFRCRRLRPTPRQTRGQADKSNANKITGRTSSQIQGASASKRGAGRRATRTCRRAIVRRIQRLRQHTTPHATQAANATMMSNAATLHNGQSVEIQQCESRYPDCQRPTA